MQNGFSLTKTKKNGLLTKTTNQFQPPPKA